MVGGVAGEDLVDGAVGDESPAVEVEPARAEPAEVPSRIGLDPDARFDVVDLITGERFRWGRDAYVRLDAFTEPAHVLAVDPRSVS